MYAIPSAKVISLQVTNFCGSNNREVSNGEFQQTSIFITLCKGTGVANMWVMHYSKTHPHPVA